MFQVKQSDGRFARWTVHLQRRLQRRLQAPGDGGNLHQRLQRLLEAVVIQLRHLPLREDVGNLHHHLQVEQPQGVGMCFMKAKMTEVADELWQDA